LIPLNAGRESGQAIILVVVCLSVFMIGALGLAIDGGQLYAHRQMAQTAADAAAQAGIQSIFNGTNSTSLNPFGTGTSPAAFTCATSDLRTPCVYARYNGFGGTADDLVTVSFPLAESGVTLASDPVAVVRVTVQRVLHTSLIQFVGPSTSTIMATAEAAIVGKMSAVSLLITHPTLANALSTSGVRVCGGSGKSVQVNSSNISAASGAGVDLSHAGPNDPGNCTTGTGADFGSFGGPAIVPVGTSLGTTGHYVQPASPILDPYADVPAPAKPAAALAKAPLAAGVSGCPVSPAKPCYLYSPGLYPTGITVKNETAVFKPGLYYMNSGGFGNDANGPMMMATGFPADASTGAGMVVYNTGIGTFTAGANASALLLGADNGSPYKGILFFEDRTATAQTHTLGGGGDIVLTGSIYLTNTLAIMKATPSQYQTLSMGGNSSIVINGLIVVGAASTSGTASITFNLSAAPALLVRQIALVR